MTMHFAQQTVDAAGDAAEEQTQGGNAATAASGVQADAGMTNGIEGEFDSEAESLAMRYAEWHKIALCRNTLKQALTEAYLKGRQDSDGL
jgi:hypothetical protein